MIKQLTTEELSGLHLRGTRRNPALVKEKTEDLQAFIPQLTKPDDGDVISEIQRELEIRKHELVQETIRTIKG